MYSKRQVGEQVADIERVGVGERKSWGRGEELGRTGKSVNILVNNCQVNLLVEYFLFVETSNLNIIQIQI